MTNQVVEPHKSSIAGLDANIAALLTYVASVVVGWIPVIRYFAWLVPLFLFFMEKKSKFVKFHAMQSFVLHLVSAVLSFVVSVVLGGIINAAMVNSYTAYVTVGFTGIIGFLTTIIALVILVFAVIAMIKAFSYKEYYIPLVGDIATKFAASLGRK
ncbi:MAG: DUF4870 domain-containing protein [Angelakisella sp.]|nr:DUF4870 domain-containing protein [Angelakisella sp.]